MVNKKKQERIEQKKADKAWALAAKARDGNQCVICGSTKMLNAHHLIPRQIRALRWDLDNSITLCVLHHRFSRQMSAHQNSLTFFLWLMRNKREQFNKLFIKINELKLLENYG